MPLAVLFNLGDSPVLPKAFQNLTVPEMGWKRVAMDMQFMPERRRREIFVAIETLKSEYRRCDIILGAVHVAPDRAWSEAAHYYKDAAPTALQKGCAVLSRSASIKASGFAGNH